MVLRCLKNSETLSAVDVNVFQCKQTTVVVGAHDYSTVPQAAKLTQPAAVRPKPLHCITL